MIHDILFLLVGLALLVVGADWVTDGAVAVARLFNVSNLMIGLTVVALGSTLPDMVVCVESAVGLSSLVIPLRADTIGFVDFFTLAGGAGLLWLLPALSRKHDIGRAAGVLLTLLYAGYMVFTVVRG